MSSRALAVVRAALMWTASALVVVVAVLAFVVSFEAISDFAVQVGAFPRNLRYCAPLLVDSFTAAATLVILWLSLTGQRLATAWDAWYAWALIGTATCVSAINVAHAPDTNAARLVAAVPPIALLLAVELLMILARRCLAHMSASQAQPAAPPAHPAAPTDGTGAEDVRTAVAELVTQEQSGTRPRLTGKQVAALVGVKERRAQVLLREFRTNNNQGAHRNGHPRTRGGN
jgi:Protein of unknown function (DUF2637)